MCWALNKRPCVKILETWIFLSYFGIKSWTLSSLQITYKTHILIWYKSEASRSLWGFLFSFKVCVFSLSEAWSTSTVAVINNTSASEYPSSMAYDTLFLNHRENPGGVLASQPLVGENNLGWTRSIKKALISKNRFGFIDGTLTIRLSF